MKNRKPTLCPVSEHSAGFFSIFISPYGVTLFIFSALLKLSLRIEKAVDVIKNAIEGRRRAAGTLNFQASAPKIY